MKKLLNVLNLFSTKKEIAKKEKNWLLIVATLSIVLSFSSCQKETTNSGAQTDNSNLVASKVSNTEASVKVFATGLNNPRGLNWGPDGYLYVAEGGVGGTNSTDGLCTQISPPVGPYTGSATGGRISKISSTGERTTLTDQLPTSQTSATIGSLISGVADVEFVGSNLYALLSGAGCTHGVASVPNGIVKVNPDGTWSMIANLSAWLQSHPAANPDPEDFEPDGTWYSMLSAKGYLYAMESNHQQIVRVDVSTGAMTQVTDLSVTYPGETNWFGPTAAAYHGNFYIGNLGEFPIRGGASKIIKMTPDGTLKDWATGLNTILGLVIDDHDRMYVLENTTGPTFPTFPTPGFGTVIRIDPNGNRTVIATGLNLPTGMAMGPDGKLYVSNWGFGPPPIGLGQIVQIDITH